MFQTCSCALNKEGETGRGRWPQPNPNIEYHFSRLQQLNPRAETGTKKTQEVSKRNVLENILHHRPGVGGKMIEG